MILTWTVEHLLAYVATRLPVAQCQGQTGADSLAEFVLEMRALWGPVALREITWPLTLKTMRA